MDKNEAATLKSGRLTNRKRILISLVFVVAIITLVVSLGSIVVILKAERSMASAEREIAEKREAAAEATQKLNKEKEAPHFFVLKDVGISLTDERGGKIGYAQFSLSLSAPTAESEHWLSLNRAKVLDAIQEVALTFSLSDFSRPEAKSQFKNSLMSAFRERFQSAAPTELDFQDWAVN
jgi:flagellar basal body-associated protein FliL